MRPANSNSTLRPSEHVERGLAGLAALAIAAHIAAHGLPLGFVPTVASAAILVTAVVFRTARVSRTWFKATASIVVMLAVAQVLVVAASIEPGWTARYYADDRAATLAWSSDYRRVDATRIDPRVSFTDDEFPSHYLNDLEFDRSKAATP